VNEVPLQMCNYGEKVFYGDELCDILQTAAIKNIQMTRGRKTMQEAQNNHFSEKESL
jgi:hypothetical protein